MTMLDSRIEIALFLVFYIFNLLTLWLGTVVEVGNPDLVWRAYCMAETYSPETLATSLLLVLVPGLGTSLLSESTFLTGVCLSLAEQSPTWLHYLFAALTSLIEMLEVVAVAELALLIELKLRKRMHEEISRAFLRTLAALIFFYAVYTCVIVVSVYV